MTMQTQRFISTVDHVVEHPEVWTQRLSKSKWGDRDTAHGKLITGLRHLGCGWPKHIAVERRSSGRVDDRPDGCAKALGRRAAESAMFRRSV